MSSGSVCLYELAVPIIAWDRYGNPWRPWDFYLGGLVYLAVIYIQLSHLQIQNSQY